MSISNQKSSSSASRPRATQRPKATPRKKANPSSIRKSQVSTKGLGSAKPKPQPTVKSGKTNLQLDSSASRNRRKGAANTPTKSPARTAFIGAIVVASLALVGVIALLVLSHMPVFVITSIDIQATEHVSTDTLAKLANIEEGTTLLSVDESQIQENIKRNPWISEVSISREFPATLGISVQERQVGAIVVIGAGASIWALGTDGVWIEPVQLDTSSGASTAALEYATELGCLLITDVPATVSPVQGSASSDDSILAVLTYQNELPETISSQARVYYAASEGSVSVVLDSGLEISLGSAEDIDSKASALNEIMSKYPDQLTYINVRVASKPTYRKVPDGTTISSVSEVVELNDTSSADDSGDDAADGDNADADAEAED